MRASRQPYLIARKILYVIVDSNLAISGTEENLLIGFSKSGYGALDLLFKHPAVFDAAAAWDFPADMTAYNNYGADGNYGTDANFQNNYRLTDTFIDTWKAQFTTEDHILISEGRPRSRTSTLYSRRMASCTLF
jgi:hypothetical protein